ncbi:MAG: right-handed parallel beta-helix repeat-containing protein [Myxococcota bacterium]
MTQAKLVVLLLLPACTAEAPDVFARPAPLSGARILEPGCAGSAYATIQAAIDDAIDGDVLDICAGTYHERLSVTGKAITLHAQGGPGTTIVDAQTFGRALAVSGAADVTVDGLDLINGLDANTGGVVWCDASTLNVRNARIANGVSGNGGGMAVIGCDGGVSDSTFEDSRGWSGGGLFVDGGTFVARRSTFTGNHADWSGGAMFGNAGAQMLESTFDGNDSRYGGAVYILDGTGEVSDNTFTNNSSTDDGGALYVLNGSPLVKGNWFESNDSGDEGGGLRIKLATSVIRGNTFQYNHANYRGGASKISHEAVELYDNVFVDNDAWSEGGALYMKESASLLSGNRFSLNSSAYGGALSIDTGWGGTDLVDCEFLDNTASQDGGQVYVNLPGYATTFTRVTMTGGTARRGGAVFGDDSELVLHNVVLDRNAASVSGGALFLSQVTGDLANVVSWRSSAPSGRAVTIANGGAFDIVNSVFGRSATGPALQLNSGAAPTVRYSVFSSNAVRTAGFPDPVGIDGNVDGVPKFRSPGTGDFRLKPRSPLVDAGDPAILDPDGTVSNIGRYGGPDAQ